MKMKMKVKMKVKVKVIKVKVEVGIKLAPGYHHSLTYYYPTGLSYTSSLIEVAHWVSRAGGSSTSAPA
jgi:hypothetical protein